MQQKCLIALLPHELLYMLAEYIGLVPLYNLHRANRRLQNVLGSSVREKQRADMDGLVSTIRNMAATATEAAVRREMEYLAEDGLDENTVRSYIAEYNVAGGLTITVRQNVFSEKIRIILRGSAIAVICHPLLHLRRLADTLVMIRGVFLVRVKGSCEYQIGVSGKDGKVIQRDLRLARSG